MIKPSQVKEGWTSHVDGVFRSVAGRSLRCRGSGCCASSNPVIVERSYPYIAVQNGYVKYRFSGNLENHAAVCVLDEVPKSYVKPAMKTLVKACIGGGRATVRNFNSHHYHHHLDHHHRGNVATPCAAIPNHWCVCVKRVSVK